MKHLIILGDGMADWPVDKLGGKTLLEYADTPAFDFLARNGRNGLLKTVPDGFHPGSEVANSSILGYDQHKVYEGRGALEAASIGVELEEGDLALRCNLLTLEDGLIKSHSSGFLPTEEADVLINFLNEHLANERVHFYTGVQFRHLLVVKGGSKHAICTPPHDYLMKPWREHIVVSDAPEGDETTEILNDLMVKSQELLANHPLNIERQKRGDLPANSIWPWGAGYRPHMETFQERFPGVKRGAMITAVDLMRGIGHYAGLRVIEVPGATGLFDTNYEGKAYAALEALKTDDFVYVHVEASDEAGHDGSVELKLRTITDLDHRLVQRILDNLGDEPVAVSLLPDHPTPCVLRTHTAQPIPFAIWYPGIEADSVQVFSENAAKEGSYGTLEGDEFIREFMKE